MAEDSSEERNEEINFKFNAEQFGTLSPSKIMMDLTKPFSKENGAIIASDYDTNPLGSFASIRGNTASMLYDDFLNTVKLTDRIDSSATLGWSSGNTIGANGMSISDMVVKPLTDMRLDIDHDGIMPSALTGSLSASNIMVDMSKPFSAKNGATIASDYDTNPLGSFASIRGNTASMLHDDYLSADNWKDSIVPNSKQIWNSGNIIEANGMNISDTVVKPWESDGIVSGTLTNSLSPSNIMVDLTKPFSAESGAIIASDYDTNPLGSFASIRGNTVSMLHDDFLNTVAWKGTADQSTTLGWSSGNMIANGMNISDMTVKPWADLRSLIDNDSYSQKNWFTKTELPEEITHRQKFKDLVDVDTITELSNEYGIDSSDVKYKIKSSKSGQYTTNNILIIIVGNQVSNYHIKEQKAEGGSIIKNGDTYVTAETYIENHSGLKETEKELISLVFDVLESNSEQNELSALIEEIGKGNKEDVTSTEFKLLKKFKDKLVDKGMDEAISKASNYFLQNAPIIFEAWSQGYFGA